MKSRCLLIICLLLHFAAVAQKLSPAQIEQIAQSLVQQQVLSPAGKEELLRFAGNKPLKAYQQLPRNAVLPTHSIYIAETDYLDFAPGQERPTQQLLDSLSGISTYPWKQSSDQLKEEYFLLQQFPTRSHLYHFINNIAAFYKNASLEAPYDANRTKLIQTFRTYFGRAMQPLWKDTTIEFNVSLHNDTPQQQTERLQNSKPFVSWIQLLQTTGLLPDSDSLLVNYYRNPANLYGSLSHSSMLTELGKYITFLDKYPYYQRQQIALLDSLQQSGLLDANAKANILTRYRPYHLLSAADIFPSCKVAIPLYYQTDIKPYEHIPENEYGRVPPKAIETVMRTVLKRLSAILPVNDTIDIHVHKQSPGSNGTYPYQELLALSRSAKLLDVSLTIDHRRYKEVIDEKEFETWIRPENFQFLNHYLEDKEDNRRCFFITPNRFTNFDAWQPDTTYIVLLTEKQADILQNRYLFARNSINGCYNGSPGDYDNAVYPGEYFRPEERLNYKQINTFVDSSIQYKIIPHIPATQRSEYIAALREQNPHHYIELLVNTPAFFSSEDNWRQWIAQLANTLYVIQPDKQLSFGEIYTPEDYNPDDPKAISAHKNAFGFILNGKDYTIPDTEGRELFTDDTLYITVNKALQEVGITTRLFRLPDMDPLYR